MVDTHSISGSIANKTIHTLAKIDSTPNDNADIKSEPSRTIDLDRATLSTMARQLGESAARARVRDTSLGPDELGALAKSIIDKLIGNSYYSNKAVHDAEIPDTEDSAHLERAEQATLYSNGGASNPFAGLPQDQLRLIIYDDSGHYTINERKAAYLENYDQEQVWKRAITKRYVDEYNATGKSTETLVMILAHYNELPPIEKAQYPANYVANLTSDDSSALAILSNLKTQSASLGAEEQS